MIVYKGLLRGPCFYIDIRLFHSNDDFYFGKEPFVVIKQNILLSVYVGQTLQRLIVALINCLFATMHIDFNLKKIELFQEIFPTIKLN